MKIIDKAFSYLPEYKTLKDAKNEMDRMNMVGYDNYAHRLGMCRIGQMGNVNFLSPTVGVTLGALKEVKDIYDKSIKNMLLIKKQLITSSSVISCSIFYLLLLC